MFLNRLLTAKPGRPLPRPTLTNAALYEDIVQNINHILSTRRDLDEFRLGFGIDDSGYRTPEQALIQLSAQLRECLSRYEPRITIERLEEDYDDAGRLFLDARCRILVTGESLRVVLRPGVSRPVVSCDPGRIIQQS